MIKSYGQKQILWHLSVPVCRTLSGIKIHIATISLRERWDLCYILGCSSAESLVKRMWGIIRDKKGSFNGALNA